MIMVIMYVGALDAKRPAVRKLMCVRGQLSIIACILTLGHNIIYGKEHFVMLFTNPAEMKPQTMAAAIISIVMIAVMIPLMVTSFKTISGKMRGGDWKKLQRLAYVFFGLIYVHVMILFIPKFEKKWMDIVLYTAPAEMKPQTMAAAIISIVMIAVMIPLMVTSFKTIRGKMRGGDWKKLQRLAYVFFGLIYVHVMVLFIPKFEKKWMDIVLYTAIFGVYLVLRVAKAARKPVQVSAGCSA